MTWRHLSTKACAAGLLLLAVIAAAWPTAASQKDRQWHLSVATQKLLEAYKLKRQAGKEPVAAIRALDDLRAARPSSSVDTAIAEVALRAAFEAPTKDAAGLFLRAADETYDAAFESDASDAAVGIHKRALEGLIEALQSPDRPTLTGATLELTGPLTSWALSWENAAEAWTTVTHVFVPASRYRTPKAAAGVRRHGIGVPLVARLRSGIPDESVTDDGLFAAYRHAYPFTAVLELDDASRESPRQALIRLLDPRLQDRLVVRATSYLLAIDIAAQLNALQDETDLLFGKAGAIHAGKYMSRTGIYLLSPPQPGKIPIIMTHGLMASAKTWLRAAEAIIRDPELRLRYEFALFTYPTGLPFHYVAALLRRALVRMQAARELTAGGSPQYPMVLVGHSMGGLVTRLQVTDSGQVLWDAIFDKPPHEVDLPPRSSDFLRELLLFEPLPFIDRVVFFSTPHRGARLAASSVGKLGATMAGLPDELKEVGYEVVSADPDALTGDAAKRKKLPDSVQSLQPEYDIILALDTLPITSGVAYHSIVGDRGKGDTPDSSDGFVEYWSSHLEGAASEKIVPSHHSSHQHPEGIAELMRILHLQLEER